MSEDEILALPNAAIERVVFYKRDEIATDLICCEVWASGETFFAHEEAPVWKSLLTKLEALPGFDSDWPQSVVLPPFERCETIAYDRACINSTPPL